jgi:hypothetical protein
MNKMMLKQEKKEKEEKQDKKKKKKEQKSVTLNSLEIKSRLQKHFSFHIGEVNATNREEIFRAVTGVSSQMIDGYTRFYWWSIIEKMIRRLRRENNVFVIKKNGNYFVLKEQNESDYFKKVCDKAIKGMEKAQVRADEWVENEKWRDVENYQNSEDDENEVEENEEEIIKDNVETKEEKSEEEIIKDNVETKEEKSEEEIIKDNLDKAKRKIIKLWKGEEK